MPKPMSWAEQQLVRALPREVIQGVECYVLGLYVLPITAKAPAILRDQVGEVVTVRGGYYHAPGCRHHDTGEAYVPILEALNAGALPCTHEPKVRGRWRADTEPQRAA